MSDLSPITFGSFMAPGTQGSTLLSGAVRRVHAVAEEHAQLDFEWEARLSFRYAETMTEAETRRAFSRLAEHLAVAARLRCHLIIDSVPLEVIPTILPQLQDMADYEVRMWQVREQVTGPDITERWISLPIRA